MFFDKLKKSNKPSSAAPLNEPATNTDESTLPFGWIYQNKEFTDKITKEYSYFLQNWIDSKQKTALERYSALKSFVLFLRDAEHLCKTKGNLFYIWFSDIIASEDYIEDREKELEELTSNFDRIDKEEKEYQNLRNVLENSLFTLVKENPEILQKDIYTHFSPLLKANIIDLLYQWDKSGKIQRVKAGNTYKIILKI